MWQKFILILTFFILLVLGVRVAMSPSVEEFFGEEAVQHIDNDFEFRMTVPVGYQFQYFPSEDGELLRIGFFQTEDSEIPNVHFWLDIVSAEKPMVAGIKKKVLGQLTWDFPREGFSRSFFRIEGDLAYESFMEELQKHIAYHKPVEEKVMPPIPDSILGNLRKEGVIPQLTADIGNTCSKGADCESGFCMASRDGGTEGACYGYIPLVGCVQVIANGEVREVCE